MCVCVCVCGVDVFVCKCKVGVCVTGNNASCVVHIHVLSELKTMRYHIPAV